MLILYIGFDKNMKSMNYHHVDEVEQTPIIEKMPAPVKPKRRTKKDKKDLMALFLFLLLNIEGEKLMASYYPSTNFFQNINSIGIAELSPTKIRKMKQGKPFRITSGTSTTIHLNDLQYQGFLKNAKLANHILLSMIVMKI
jgi:hypothetical protein